MDPASYVNRFCLFFRDGRIDAGWISALQKNKLAIQPLQGKVLFLAPNRLLFDWHAAGINPSNALSELQRDWDDAHQKKNCLLYTSPSPRDGLLSRMPSSA